MKNKIKDPKNIYLYRIWAHIKNRCYVEKNSAYKNYGGRGIDMDLSWKQSSNKFIIDILNSIGHRTTEKHKLDRIDNNIGYYINNIKWSTAEENNSNKRNNVFLTINGDTKTVAALAKISGIKKQTIHKRIKLGWAADKILSPIENKIAKIKIHYLYSAWAQIKQRCYNPNNSDFISYSSKGIIIFNKWKHNPKKFIEDIINEIGERQSQQHSLDRKNNNGNYEPGNLSWSTQKEQNKNKNNNIIFIIDGENKTLSEISAMTKLTRACLEERVNRGWVDEQLLRPKIIRKFNIEISNKIREEFSAGASKLSLAKKYNVGIALILDITLYRGAYENDIKEKK